MDRTGEYLHQISFSLGIGPDRELQFLSTEISEIRVVAVQNYSAKAAVAPVIVGLHRPLATSAEMFVRELARQRPRVAQMGDPDPPARRTDRRDGGTIELFPSV